MTPSPPFHDLTQTETGLIRTLMLLCSENSHRMHNWQKWQRAINTMYNSYVNVQERSKGDSNHWNRLCGECSRSRTRRKRQREDTRRIITRHTEASLRRSEYYTNMSNNPTRSEYHHENTMDRIYQSVVRRPSLWQLASSIISR